MIAQISIRPVFDYLWQILSLGNFRTGNDGRTDETANSDRGFSAGNLIQDVIMYERYDHVKNISFFGYSSDCLYIRFIVEYWKYL